MSVTAMKTTISQALSDSHVSNDEVDTIKKAEGQSASKAEYKLAKELEAKVTSGSVTVEDKDRFDALMDQKPTSAISRFAAGSTGVVTLSFLLSQTWIGKPLAIPALIAASPVIAAAAIAVGVKVMLTD